MKPETIVPVALFGAMAAFFLMLAVLRGDIWIPWQ